MDVSLPTAFPSIRPLDQLGEQIARQSGVTLTELMVTIAIAAILITIAAPNFTSFGADQRIRAAATDLQTALFVTRSEAIKRNMRVTLAPHADGWGAGWQLTNPEDTSIMLIEQNVPDGVTITGAPDAGITYRSSGRITTTPPPTIRVSSSSVPTARNRCLRIELSGQPTMLESCP